MHHLLVYTKLQAASASLAALTALTDPAVPQDQNGRYILPTQWKLLTAAGFGVNLSALQINSPYFRRTFLPGIWPLNGSNTPTTAALISDYREYPMTLPALEGIEIDASNSDTVTHQATAGLFISDMPIQPIQGGEVYSLAFTGAVTATANAFVSGNFTFSQTLPQGTYAVVGGAFYSATGMFARLILPGQAYRPGFFCSSAVTNATPWQGRKQPMGNMGQFQSTALPQFEIYCSAADTSQTGFLDLVKIA